LNALGQDLATQMQFSTVRYLPTYGRPSVVRRRRHYRSTEWRRG